MSRTKDPDYVSGKRGHFEIAVPIVHPPFCVCDVCPRHRGAGDWDRPITIRSRRKSPFPKSRKDSAEHAWRFKGEEEARLVDAVAEAERRRLARANAVTFGRVCDAYRRHLIDAGKRYDTARYIIDNIERFFGRGRDAARIGWAEYQELLGEVALLSTQTRRHYASMLLAILNHAVEYRILPGPHALGRVPLPVVRTSGTPVTWSKVEVATLLGPAMAEFEREQACWNEKVAAEKKSARTLRTTSEVPLRGFCYVAYFTLMRPKNNFALTWEEVRLHPIEDTGTFRLVNHKNERKGITAEGPLAVQLVCYLRSIRPRGATGLVHPNPATGKAYVDIRKQWNRLITIASSMLGYELTGRKADFFTFRHTGASHLAEKIGHNPMPLVKMMGDTSVETVRKHYCNLDLEFMREMIDGWALPDEVTPVH